MEVEDRAALEPHGNCAAQGPRALCSAGATVAVFNEDTEAPVVGQQQWEAVHELRSLGSHISAIARQLGLDRKTVRSCLRQPSWRPYRRSDTVSLLDPHRQWMASRAPEVNYSARILWQGAACAQRLCRQLRHRAPRGRATAPGCHRGVADAAPLRDRPW
jgi:hypothetical protein